ncbi:MAG: hypothetical protein ACUVTD_02500 [Nitrososphaerales archaeon]
MNSTVHLEYGILNCFLEEGFALKIMSKSEVDTPKLARVAFFVKEHLGATIDDVAKGLGISYKSANRYLLQLRWLGILVAKFEGKDRELKFYPSSAHRQFTEELAPSLLEALRRCKSYLEGR